MGGVCGNGRFSTVFFVESIKTGKILVAKLFSEERSTEDIEREVTILSEMNHSNLPRYKGTFTSETGLIVVMKQANGVAITNFIDHISISLYNMVNKSSVLSEDILRRLSREIISAVEYLHAKNIMHLDIRPENLLVDDHVTLIDFGCAQFCNEAQLSWGDGDESYSAPERFSGLPPTIKSDIWSFGAVLYVLCFGDLPHHTTTDDPRVECSLALINILCQTLVQDSNRRLSAEQCLKHPWISGITGDNTCSNAAL